MAEFFSNHYSILLATWVGIGILFFMFEEISSRIKRPSREITKLDPYGNYTEPKKFREYESWDGVGESLFIGIVWPVVLLAAIVDLAMEGLDKTFSFIADKIALRIDSTKDVNES